MKTLFVFFLGLLVLDVAFAQKKDTLVYYLDNSAKEVSNKADADVILMISPPDPTVNKNLFIVKGYYPNGKIKLLGSSTTPALPLNLHGVYYTFYPNGHKSRMQTFENGKLVGNIVEYYPNGEIYTVKTYIENGPPLFQECRDSTGVVLAEKGNGIWIDFGGDFGSVGIKGKVEKGMPQGVWVKKLNDSVTFEKMFKNGDLLSADRIYSYKSDSTIYPKKNVPTTESVDVIPEFKGGTEAFYRYLYKSIRYPAQAREQNMQGRVVVSFIVEKDGYLTNFKIVKGIGGGCDEEAMRVLAASPPWTPASIKGKTVRLMYSVPMIFKLASGDDNDLKAHN